MDAAELHESAIVFDAHCDTLHDVLAGKRRLGERSDEGHLDLPRMREGGVTAQIFALFPGREYLSHDAARRALCLLDAFYQEQEANPDTLILITTAADIEQAKEEGKVAAVLGLEGAEALEGELGLLRVFYRLGVRNVGLTWNPRNRAGYGVKSENKGLTEFGVELVQELNRLGVMIDVAHLAPAGVRDVLALSEGPVIASHANAKALCPHWRNLSDEQLEAIAEKGGVVGVTFVPAFLDPDEHLASLERVLDHIDHIVSVAGVEHVGLGSDFDGFSGQQTKGLEDVTKLPKITVGLLQRSYDEEEVHRILGGNFLRVFRQVVG